MQDPTPRYPTGEAIRIGDRVDYAGASGRVLFVIDTRSFSPEHPAEDWSYLGIGFMIEAAGYGLVFFEKADEDLVLVGRS